MSRYIFLLIILALILIFYFLPRGDDAGEIEAVFDEIVEAAGKKDYEGIMEHFSVQYKDEYGAGYPVVKNIIIKVFEKYDSVEASYSGLSVVINKNEYGEKEAAANTDVEVTGYKSGIPDKLIGDNESSDNITVTLRKSGLGGWKIIRVEGLDNPEDYY